MTHATAPKAGRRNPSCFFTYKPPCESDRRSGDLFSCHRQPPFLSLRFPLYCNDSLLYRYSFAVGSLPVGTRFSVAKVLPWKHTQVPLTLFEHNFPAAFPISNRPYLANAQYRNDKIPPKFLVCCFLLGNLWMHVKIRSLREKPEGFRREGK